MHNTTSMYVLCKVEGTNRGVIHEYVVDGPIIITSNGRHSHPH